MGCDLFLWVRR